MRDLINPFTPSDIASSPELFFGRAVEVQALSRAILQGSVTIQGTVGIGKSSLLSRTISHMDGFASEEDSICVLAVGHRDIGTVDDAARLVLDKLSNIDEKKETIKIGFPKFFQYESSEAYSNFVAGRHLSALVKIIEDKSFKEAIGHTKLLIIAIDEADKCAAAVARLMRTVCTSIQLQGIKNLRFILAGVSPFYEDMIKEDEGISRFVYKTITLSPLEPEDARSLLESKFKCVLKQSNDQGFKLNIDPSVIDRILQLSGGHPHLLQLLGSHVVEHEHMDPDGVIDSKDLFDSLRSICFESRGPIYERIKHSLVLEGKDIAFSQILRIAGGVFPARIDREKALDVIEQEDLEWLCERNILTIISDSEYGIVDEFLRIRLLIEAEQKTVGDMEEQLIEKGNLGNTEEYFDDYIVE